MNTWRAILAVTVLLLTVLGWAEFWFLTDDALITFRYGRNWLDGVGLVYNPAPYEATEGYTSFLWLVMTTGVWAVTGLDPTVTANPMSLGFGIGILALVWLAMEMTPLPPHLERYRIVWMALVFAGIVSNRTFLTWLSSGLETALFDFLVVLWTLLAFLPPTRKRGLWLCAAAALIALTRPDGLLFVAATAALWAVERYRHPDSGQDPLVAAPLLLVPAHILWRVWMYGDWLPNTYYAKHVAPWPEAGWRYFLSFAVEYGVWVFGALLVAWVIVRRPWQGRLQLGAAVAIATLVAHAGYYTLRIGGDHFEYRVYAHLIPLMWLAAGYLAIHTARSPWAFAILGAFWVVAQPIPWTHHIESKKLDGRRSTFKMKVAVAPHLPAFLGPITHSYDNWQFWMIERSVCMRQHEHAEFYEYQAMRWPSVEVGSQLPWSDRNVAASSSIGMPGWTLPHVAIFDMQGLTDRIVAHNPVEPGAERNMAHDRKPPEGYMECFKPNVMPGRPPDFKLRLQPRPLTDEQIVACQAEYAAKLGLTP